MSTTTIATGFIFRLCKIVYDRIFTVRRVELLIPDARPGLGSSGLGRQGRSVSRNRPYLPSERNLATQVLWNYMKLNNDLMKASRFSKLP